MLRSRTTLIYTPENAAVPPLTLLRYGSIMPDPLTAEWNSTITISPRLGSRYAHHRCGGGRYCTLTWGILRRFPTVAAAETWQHNLITQLHTHPNGSLTEHYAFENGTPTATRQWRATLITAAELPLNPETMNLHELPDPDFAPLSHQSSASSGGLATPKPATAAAGTAWRGITHRFILTPQE